MPADSQIRLTDSVSCLACGQAQIIGEMLDYRPTGKARGCRWCHSTLAFLRLKSPEDPEVSGRELVVAI